MQVIDLEESLCPLYFVCLEDWSEEMKEAGDHKARWYEVMRERGLRVKLAVDDEGTVGGMIQYLPIEHALAEGEGLYFVLCIWVHGHKKGRGDFRGRGMGRALLRAAELDVRQLGAGGLAVWGIWLPFFMQARWFRKQGYVSVDRQGLQVLLWKRFAEAAGPPRWPRQRRPVPKGADRAHIHIFHSGWCPAQSITVERAKRAAAEFGERVSLEVVDTKDRAVRQEWGLSDEVFIDGKPLRAGPPPSFAAVRRKVAGAVRRRG
ncbi:MAG: GNAT family N-acetyltransferase [Candidatus Latescibacterota bacterium]